MNRATANRRTIKWTVMNHNVIQGFGIQEEYWITISTQSNTHVSGCVGYENICAANGKKQEARNSKTEKLVCWSQSRQLSFSRQRTHTAICTSKTFTFVAIYLFPHTRTYSEHACKQCLQWNCNTKQIAHERWVASRKIIDRAVGLLPPRVVNKDIGLLLVFVIGNCVSTQVCLYDDIRLCFFPFSLNACNTFSMRSIISDSC